MKKKILIVEDEEILEEMYQDKFVEAGFLVVLAETAEDGLKALEKEKPDLVLLDILLPRESGIYFLRELRKKPKFSSLPIVAFSNYDHPETRKEALALGIKDYLLKTDFTPRQIIDRVKDYLK